MGALIDLLEDDTIQLHFIKIVLEEWPALALLTEADRQSLQQAMDAALKTLACSLQTITIVGDELSIVLQLNPECSVDQVAEALEGAIQSTFAGRADAAWNGLYSVYSVTPPELAAALEGWEA